MEKISVGIVEDTDDIREMWSVLINGSPGYECLRAYRSAEEAIADKTNAEISVFLVDVNLPGMSGIEFIAKIRPERPHTQFIVCTVYENDEVIFDALSAGAMGYMLKSTAPARLLESINEVHMGGSPMSLSVARRVVSHFSKPRHTSEAASLTTREREVLDMLSQGLLYKEIAEKLSVAKGTIHIHIHNIYEKLQVSNRTEAINKAFTR